ncbi:glycosyltransferase, partial [Calothrix sp. UHCC 0171]|uniref:glycosyltransferase n=1 Tax=Calothrix sp. UHCC 0171 TaxID=3110245 RepID=UPI002B20C612
MKILISAYACLPNRTRDEGFGWYCSSELAKLGYEIWVLTASFNKAKIEATLTDNPIHNLHFIYVEHPTWFNSLMYHVFGRDSSNYHYLVWQYYAYKVALRLDKEQNFDLIHHITIASLPCGSWLWRLQKPLIFGPAGGGQVASPVFKKYFLNEWRLEGIRTFITEKLLPLALPLRKTIKRTNLLLAANSDTIHLGHRLGAQRIELFLDTHLSEDYFCEEPPTRAFSQELRLLWVGRLYPRKALLLALEALSKVNPSIPFKLTILGSGPQDCYVSSWTKELNIEDKVEHIHQVSWEEVRNKYLNSDVLLFTSMRDTFGSQLMEAMAQALPIICLNHQGARDFVPNNAGI